MSFKVPKGVSKVPFSIRVDEEDYAIIKNIHEKNNRSYNAIVNAMIKYAIANMDIEDIKKFSNED